jgi:type I restriction-modification system DNA methylase subunit
MESPSEKNGRNCGTRIGFEATFWQAGDNLRNNMDAAEYKHIVLRLFFLKRAPPMRASANS